MTETKHARGGRIQQVAHAGEHFVVAELNKRGAFAMSFAGNMPKIDLIACNHNRSHTVYIQVKTKRGGRNFQTSTKESSSSVAIDPGEEKEFWVFVDIGDKNSTPRYWIAPDSWVRKDIYDAHQKYLDRHGGKRPKNSDSTHHAIEEKRLEKWRDCWDILGVFD